jgi:hypothetical protein
MARILISEDEKFEILNKHNNFKKILENELKHLNRGLVSEQTLPTGQVSDPLLSAASKAGCLNNGNITNFEGKTVYVKRAKKDLSPKFAIGDTLVLYNDYSYFVFPQDGSSRKGPYKWSCPEINSSIEQQNKTSLDKTKLEGNWKTKEELLKTDTEQNIVNPVMYETTTLNGVTLYRRKASSSIGSALTDDQQKIVNKWTSQGFKLRKDLDPEEAKTWKARVVSPASEGYFSQDLVMYSHPKQTIDPNVSTSIQTSVEENIPKDKKDCKTNIENYYTNFKKKRVIEPNQLAALKYKVQACKNEFYGDWGFLGGNKMDNILDIMSGVKVGGPSTYGDDKMWRLN